MANPNPWFSEDGFTNPIKSSEHTQTVHDANREYRDRRIERVNTSIAEHTQRAANTEQ